jgi:hypothetical protein
MIALSSAEIVSRVETCTVGVFKAQSVEIWVPWKVVPLWFWVSNHKREMFVLLYLVLYV